MTTYYLSNKSYDCENGLTSKYNVGSYDLERFTNDCAAAAAEARCKKHNVDTGTYKNGGSVYCSQFNKTVTLSYQQMKCKMSDCDPPCWEADPNI